MMTLVDAAQMNRSLEAALVYARSGYSVIPVYPRSKLAAVDWKPFQSRRATQTELLEQFHSNPRFNVAVICGAVSGNLVVLDCDEMRIARALRDFGVGSPLTETYMVKTARGVHIYYRVDKMPPTSKIKTTLGDVDIRGDGNYILVPPSIHPTGAKYTPCRLLPVLHVPHIDQALEFLNTLALPPVPRAASKPRIVQRPVFARAAFNPRLINAIAGELRGKGYKERGDWLDGQCPLVENHKHGDEHASFGFHTVDGRAYCFSCKFIRTIDLCIRLGLDVNKFGGLYAK